MATSFKRKPMIKFNPYEQQDVRRVIWEQTNAFISMMGLGIAASDNNPDAMNLVMGAGTRLDLLDGQLSIYWKDEIRYKDIRDKIRSRLKHVNLNDNSLKNRLYVRDLYRLWWNQMSKLLADFNFYPAIPTSRSIDSNGEVDDDSQPLLL